ncbi:MAG: LUD domain-containing protein [Candidatus Aenigmatarchaeota archaeon]
MMKIKEILSSKRICMAKVALSEAFNTYKKNRERAMQLENIELLKKELRRIKEFSISNIENLKERAIKNLEEHGVRVLQAENSNKAKKMLLEIIPEKEKIVKSKSNVLNEIKVEEIFEGRNELTETDCGDFLVKVCDEVSSHPVTPALHIPIEIMLEKIRKKFKVELEKSHEKIVEWVKYYLKKKIVEAKIGLTGANAITADGTIVILENEGNISLISRIPEKHVIVSGIDKLVPSLQDAMVICKASSIWGTGTSLPTYINIISSPSKTADIEKKIVYGVHGAKEVFLILVDNGRSSMIKEGLGEILYCINCGSCLYFCPVYRQIFDNYGYDYLGGIGIAKTAFINDLKIAFERGLYCCTTCEACKINCPLDINVAEIVRNVREASVRMGMETETNKKMIKNIREYGNPFGKIGEEKIPKELYCC